MISITIYQNRDRVTGFRCSGHSGYAESGNDVVCAGVSALVINTVNSIEKFTSATFRIETDAETGLIDFRLDREAEHDTELFIRSMVLGLQGIQSDYGNEYLILDFKEV